MVSLRSCRRLSDTACTRLPRSTCKPKNCSKTQSQYYLFWKDLNMIQELWGLFWVFIVRVSQLSKQPGIGRKGTEKTNHNALNFEVRILRKIKRGMESKHSPKTNTPIQPANQLLLFFLSPSKSWVKHISTLILRLLIDHCPMSRNVWI